MRLIVEKTDSLQGSIEIPASKSHTIRAVIIASLAEGTSVIKNPLTSEDTKVAVEACKALGADIKQNDEWIITGFGGKLKQPQTTINMLNSGTSAKIIMAITALGDFKATLDGDASLRKRPMQPLIMALNDLGAEVVSVNNNGCLPAEVQGPIKGGKTQVDGISSNI